jgi:clan AA aspartic protease (TIGR02281 family)
MVNRGLFLVLSMSLLLNAYFLVGHWWLKGEESAVLSAKGSIVQAENGAVNQKTTAPVSVDQEDRVVVNREDVAALFAEGDYLAALSALSLLLADDAGELRYQWLAQCMEWIVEGEHEDQVDRFIQAGLNLNRSDVDFGQLRAEQLIQQGDISQGIDLLYELMNYSDSSLKGEFASRLQVLFQNQVKQLSEQQAWQPLVDFAEKLLWHEPNHPPYLLVHARALIKLNRYELARASLLPISQDAYYGARARNLLDTIHLLQQGNEHVALQRVGTHHLVNAKVNDQANLKLLIDTGASFTVVASDVFESQLKNDALYVRNVAINTAGGKVDAQLYRVDRFKVGSYAVSNMDIVVMPLDDVSGGQGLLGMNYLQRFEFEIDQQRDELLLSPRQ